MNWHEKKDKSLQSDQGYRVATTTINGHVRFCAYAPSRDLLGVRGKREKATELCEQHLGEKGKRNNASFRTH